MVRATLGLDTPPEDTDTPFGDASVLARTDVFTVQAERVRQAGPSAP